MNLEAVRLRAGELWLEAALAEHASVASFARVAQELLALGAPPTLVEANLRAGIDEIAHAQTCFTVASRLLGRPVGPGALPIPQPRDLTVVELAVSTFLEACVEESLGAMTARVAAMACVDPEDAVHLHRIAEDEAGHAALGWQTLRWAIDEGGDEAVIAVLAAARTYAEALPPPFPPDPFAATLLGLGAVPESTMVALTHQAWCSVVEPTMRAIFAHRKA